MRSSLSLARLICSMLLVLAVQSGAKEPSPLEEDFSADSLSVDFEVEPSGIVPENGFLVLKPSKGQQFLATAEPFAFGSVTVEFQMVTQSDDDHIIYYLGLQSLRPWAEELAWIKVQEGSLFVTVKNGAMVEEKLIGYLNTEQTYILTVEWSPDRVAIILDGKTLFETENAEVIPQNPLYLCFIANTQPSSTGEDAELRIDHVSISKQEQTKPSANAIPKAVTSVLAEQSLATKAGAKISVVGKTITLESETSKCVFDLSNGISVAKLYDKLNGVDAIKDSLPGRLPLFMVNGPGFSLSAADFVTKDVVLSEEGDGCSAQISLEAKERKIAGTLSLFVGKDGRMKWKLSMVPETGDINRLQLVFPVIGQIAIGGNAEENRFFFPQRTGIEGKASIDLTQEYGGGLAWMQVIGVHSPAYGNRLTVFPMDSSGQYKVLRFRKPQADGKVAKRWAEIIYQPEVPRQDVLKYDGPGMGMAWYYLRQPASKGEAVVSPEISVFFGTGGWKETLADYSSWVRTWYQPPVPPSWFKSMANFWNVHPARFWSETEKRYIGTEVIGKQKVDIVQVFGWEDFANVPKIDEAFKNYQPGDFKINVARGGSESLRAEVRRHHDAGVRYTLYTNIRFAYRGSEFGRKSGEQTVAMHAPGAPTMFADNEIFCISLYSESWWKHLIGRLTQIVQETGIDGVYLDELGLLFPDYDPSHAHWQALSIPQDTAFVARRMTELGDALHAINPEAIVWTEHAGSDWFSQYSDGSWIQTFYSSQYDWVEKDFDDASLYFFRFLFPEHVLAEWGESKDGPKRCFFNGVGRDSGCGLKLDTILREHADAFATLKPEAHIPTLVEGVLANKFPITGKTIVTLYNKNKENTEGDLVALPASGKKNWRITELVSGKPCEFRYDLASNSLVVAVSILAGEVAAICITEEPE